jgi:hypothetical protein
VNMFLLSCLVSLCPFVANQAQSLVSY